MDELFRLPKATTARVYCLCFIAERSVDFASANPSLWQDFLAFFSPERKRWFEKLNRDLPNVASPRSPEIQTGNSLHLVLLQLWALLRPCPPLFAFSDSEIGFIRKSLSSFQELLHVENPEPAQLAAIRRDLGNCQWVIERKWLNRNRWNVLRRADHFCRNPALAEALDVDTAVGKFTLMNELK
jgi:hypothetical protein